MVQIADETRNPRSVSSGTVCVLSAVVFAAGAAGCRLAYPYLPAKFVFLISLALLVLFQATLELAVRKVHRKETTGLVWSLEHLRENLSLKRSLVKLTGLYLVLAALALVYWTVPEYSKLLYRPFWNLLELIGPYFVVLSVPYFVLVDALMDRPRDGYWQTTQLVAFRWKLVNWRPLGQHLLGWVIKGFYLPLMCSFLLNMFSWFEPFKDPGNIAGLVYDVSTLMLLVDTGFAVIGYTFTIRVLDSHVRSVNPFVWGWIACLVLYKPFWEVAGRMYQYNDGTAWYEWYSRWPVLLYVWGAMIIALKISWAWSNIMFGFRFSNLTNRGIITNGPFRFTKHPSYFSKNIAWWLISVPFLSSAGPLMALQHSAALLGVNMIYAVRARSEEMHLSEEPTYVAYALWIERHGIFRWIGRIAPWLRYAPPK